MILLRDLLDQPVFENIYRKLRAREEVDRDLSRQKQEQEKAKKRIKETTIKPFRELVPCCLRMAGRTEFGRWRFYLHYCLRHETAESAEVWEIRPRVGASRPIYRVKLTLDGHRVLGLTVEGTDHARERYLTVLCWNRTPRHICFADAQSVLACLRQILVERYRLGTP